MTPTATGNILFIMCDQLRWDYLSCYGHPRIETPNIDRLADTGVRFTRAYCQAPLCGPSRASFYTGRYMFSHGVMANKDPLKVGELTLGDYLRPTGMRTVLTGKSEASANCAALQRLGVDQTRGIGLTVAQNGFESYEHFAGLYPDPVLPKDLGYNDYLRAQGYDGENPWERYANSATNERGQIVSGWYMRNANLPARVPEPHSETAFTANRAIEFLESVNAEDRWCLHLSFIKPHWPYLAPDPYHSTYTESDAPAAIRHPDERVDPHPVYQAFMQQTYSRNFSNDQIRYRVVPTYMGLIKQVDDHIGRLIRCLEARGLFDTTLIVFTSDHGDYLGDHWLGEKDLFHEPSVHIPLIVRDPNPLSDPTRGTTQDLFAEAVDMVPTLVDFAGGKFVDERMEGRSLLPLLRCATPPPDWRDCAVSEIDYSERGPRQLLQLHPCDCRAYMVRTDKWKYIFHEGFPPQLFDIANDPDEFIDLGRDPGYEVVRREMHERLFTWLRRRRNRTEISTSKLFDRGPDRDQEMGILIGHW
jgi:arylsulfatase A-like enzyme